MNSNSRRKFTKSLLTGMALPAVFPAVAANSDFSDRKKENLPWIPQGNDEAYWESVKAQFRFAPGLKYFNNASLGSCPDVVRTKTNEYRDLLDSFPSKYMWGGWKEEIEQTRQSIADLFSVSNEEIALTHNTTEGMNLIAQSIELQPGDEVILADHEHTSGSIPWKYWQESKGIKIVRPVLPILPQSVEELVETYRKAITPRTKVISMCHIVNTNGMILPVKEVSAMAHERGILVAVDAAQSAGMFKIDLHDLGCDFYTASAHKWLFAPKGIGFFYARQESQKHLKPLVVCRGYDDESIRRIENYNTRNLPELLGMGEAVNYHNQIGGDKITQRSYELKTYFRSKLEDKPKFKLKSPEADELSAAIQVVEVVGKDVVEVKELLFKKEGIDCRPMTTFDLNALRISLAIYITKKDIDGLVNTLESIA